MIGQAREQVRRSRLVAEQLRQPQAPGEVGLAVAGWHAVGHWHVPAELPQGEHFQALVTRRAGRGCSGGEISQRRGDCGNALVRPAPDDPGTGADLKIPGPFGRLKRLGGQGN